MAEGPHCTSSAAAQSRERTRTQQSSCIPFHRLAEHGSVNESRAKREQALLERSLSFQHGQIDQGNRGVWKTAVCRKAPCLDIQLSGICAECGLQALTPGSFVLFSAWAWAKAAGRFRARPSFHRTWLTCKRPRSSVVLRSRCGRLFRGIDIMENQTETIIIHGV